MLLLEDLGRICREREQLEAKLMGEAVAFLRASEDACVPGRQSAVTPMTLDRSLRTLRNGLDPAVSINRGRHSHQ